MEIAGDPDRPGSFAVALELVQPVAGQHQGIWQRPVIQSQEDAPDPFSWESADSASGRASTLSSRFNSSCPFGVTSIPARRPRATQPARLAERAHEGHAKRSGEVVGPFGPVEALPGEAPARRLQRRHIDADPAKPGCAGRRHVKGLAFGRDQELAPLKRVCDRDAQLAREMVVAAARKPQVARFCVQGLAPDRPRGMDRGEPLERLAEARRDDSSDAAPLARPP